MCRPQQRAVFLWGKGRQKQGCGIYCTEVLGLRLSIVSAYEKGKTRRFLIYIGVLCVAAVCLFVWVNIKIRPFMVSVAKGYAENIVSNTLNDITDDVMKNEKYTFVDILKDGNGQIAAVTMNSAETNLFITKISIGLKNKIADMDEAEVKIPMGNFLPYPFLAGLGPKVTVRFLILANSSVSPKEEFRAEGINQTLYTLSFRVETRVGIYIPTMHTTVEVENFVPIAQTLIVGGVPESYTNVEGLEGTVQDAVMNIN